MKRFVVCLDGTWNNASRETRRRDGALVYRPTNVLKLARATLPHDDATPQITYYNAGVGAMNRAPDLGARIVRQVENTVGGGWGGGFEVNIEEAYSFLADNYTAGDEIFVFGFSRGAAQARSLCRLIEWVGGFPSKNDVYYVPRLVTRYLRARGAAEHPTLWDELNQRRDARGDRRLDPIQPANVVFLGVWDTVLALGSRILAGGGTTRREKQFHTPAEPPRQVRHVRHAIAIDESRHDFQPEVFRGDGEHPSLEQRWFAGAHADVGGGTRWDGLANCALRWIVDEAVEAGLKLRTDFLEFYREGPDGEANTKSLGFKIADVLLTPIRGFHGVRDVGSQPGMTLDASVFHRLNLDPPPRRGEDAGGFPTMAVPYRPDNLLAYLARHPEHDAQLGAKVLDAVETRRRS